MKRREFVTLAGSAAAAWPVAARAQQRSAMPVVGFLSTGTLESSGDAVAEFRSGLADAGYFEGKNIAIQWGWGNNQQGHLQTVAAELVDLRVVMIVAYGPLTVAHAAKTATSTIPIVIAGGVDPVRFGLVASLNRPGGNITGVTAIHSDLTGKRLDLLCKLVTQATTIGYLTSVQLANEIIQAQTSETFAAARALDREVVLVEARQERDFELSFATLAERRVGALVVEAFPAAFNDRPQIVALAARHRIPAMYPQMQYARDGGLMSYSAAGTVRQAASYYVPQILKGAKPGDLPVQLPTKFEFVINLKTAKALGIEVPATLLALADEVIE